MATTQRIQGNLTIQTLNSGGQVTVSTSNAVIDGNLTVVNGNLSATTLLAGNATVTGNVTGGFFYGNGAGLTGIVANANVGTASQLVNGTSVVDIPISGGNVAFTINGVSNVVVCDQSGINVSGYVYSNTVSAIGNVFTAGNVSATGTVTSAANVIGANITTTGLVAATGNIQGGNLLTGGMVSATGNLSGSYILGNGALLTGVITSVANINSGTSNVTVVSSSGNVTVGVGGTGNVAVFATTGEYITGVLSASGNVIGGNVTTAGLISATGAITGAALTGTGLTVASGNITCGNIVNNNANGVGNIGSSGSYFNTVFALATSAQYADLAECYEADAIYEPGTVVMFGGPAEVTICTQDACPQVAGVVSTNPAYKMNSGLASQNVAVIALVGRVPVKVVGPVKAGAMMVSAGNGQARAELNPAMGTVIGKAVKDFEGATGVVEIVVGRL